MHSVQWITTCSSQIDLLCQVST
uniref:Uncharacterized protein n=1 Tax=Arundo donax TaxID=35708 RepID=A0A0A9AJM0_ARUDO